MYRHVIGGVGSVSRDSGRMIFLHGASSSGKTTLAETLRSAMDAPFWHLSIDHFRDAGVWPMGSFAERKFAWKEHRAGFFAGFHACLPEILNSGNDVILEHILDTPCWHAELRAKLRGYDLFFVGLRTHLDALKQREAHRGDRPAGSAEQDFGTVHCGLSYDLELDGTVAAADNARILIDAWQRRSGPSHFFDESITEIREQAGVHARG